MTETPPRPVLETLAISKAFPGVQALAGINLQLFSGEVTALIGENGAGKSTLVKILTGVYAPDDGRILLDGANVDIPNAEAAFHRGITATHQETVLFDELSVTENVFLGHPITGRFGWLDWKAMRARTRAILAEIEVDLDPDVPLRELAIARKHLVAIARALSVDAKIVIMDEPTASLSHKEVEELYQIIAKLKREGKAILFISHKFEEIFQIADRYTVLRDGRSVGEGLVAEATPANLISLMVGRTVDMIFPKPVATPGETVFSVAGLCHPTEFADIDFDVRKGEILGFYGLVGSGRSEVMQAIFGVTHPSAGTVTLAGKPITVHRPADAVATGVVYVPEERQRQGVVLALPVFANITLPSLGRLTRNGFLDLAREFDLARDYAEQPRRARLEPQPGGRHAVGRQPAEGGDRQVAGHQPARHHPRRADQGHRRRLQGRRPRLHAPAHHARRRHRHGLIRTARDPRHERPRRGHAPGPHRFPLRPAGPHRREAGRRRHRQRRRGRLTCASVATSCLPSSLPG